MEIPLQITAHDFRLTPSTETASELLSEKLRRPIS